MTGRGRENVADEFRVYYRACLVLCRCSMEDTIEGVASTVVRLIVLDHGCCTPGPRDDDHLRFRFDDMLGDGIAELIVVYDGECGRDEEMVEISEGSEDRHDRIVIDQCLSYLRLENGRGTAGKFD